MSGRHASSAASPAQDDSPTIATAPAVSRPAPGPRSKTQRSAPPRAAPRRLLAAQLRARRRSARGSPPAGAAGAVPPRRGRRARRTSGVAASRWSRRVSRTPWRSARTVRRSEAGRRRAGSAPSPGPPTRHCTPATIAAGSPRTSVPSSAMPDAARRARAASRLRRRLVGSRSPRRPRRRRPTLAAAERAHAAATARPRTASSSGAPGEQQRPRPRSARPRAWSAAGSARSPSSRSSSAHLPAQRRLRDPQPLGGPGEVALPRHGEEVLEAAQVRHGLSPVPAPRPGAGSPPGRARTRPR